MMCQPYIGIFTDGAEQWCKKMRLSAPMFSNAEKGYYTSLRLSHKFLEKSYAEYKKMLLEKFWESTNYFYKIRSFREKVICRRQICMMDTMFFRFVWKKTACLCGVSILILLDIVWNLIMTN